jgi:hypothetical protein
LEFLNAADNHNPHPAMAILPYCLLVFAIVGPLDWFMLLALRMPARHWITMLGWLGFVASGGLLLAARPSQSEMQIHRFSLIDQINNQVVASTDLVTFESNRKADYSPDLSETEWWEPANQSAANFGLNRFLDFDFREDQKGCRPAQLRLKAFEPQSLRGESITALRPFISASLSIQKSTITAKITNNSPFIIEAIQILTKDGITAIDQSINAGRSINVSAILQMQSTPLDSIPADYANISPDRTERIQSMIKSGNFACVIGKLIDPADENHWQIIRALVPIEK